MGKLILAGCLLSQIQLLTASCTTSGEPMWNHFLHSVCFSDTIHKNVFLSPDKAKRIEVGQGTGYRLIVNGQTVAWAGYGRHVVMPTAFSWSPKSDAFFVDDGEGSGLYSVLRVFRMQGSTPVEVPGLNKLVAVAFRKVVGCPNAAADPAVWAVGWSKDGDRLLVFAQATVDDPCGAQGDFRGVVLNVRTRALEDFYDETETRHTFRELLPGNMR